MKIGCPKEIKPQEFRVGMTPNAAQEAVARGHEVVIETGAGIGRALTTNPTSLLAPRSWTPQKRCSPLPT